MLALYLAACHTPEPVTTVFKCSWGWTQKASETCRVILQLLIKLLPSCITMVFFIYIRVVCCYDKMLVNVATYVIPTQT